jgi:hypothetical protein
MALSQKPLHGNCFARDLVAGLETKPSWYQVSRRPKDQKYIFKLAELGANSLWVRYKCRDVCLQLSCRV